MVLDNRLSIFSASLTNYTPSCYTDNVIDREYLSNTVKVIIPLVCSVFKCYMITILAAWGTECVSLYGS